MLFALSCLANVAPHPRSLRSSLPRPLLGQVEVRYAPPIRLETSTRAQRRTALDNVQPHPRIPPAPEQNGVRAILRLNGRKVQG
jgi:hypothetical protein